MTAPISPPIPTPFDGEVDRSVLFPLLLLEICDTNPLDLIFGIEFGDKSDDSSPVYSKEYIYVHILRLNCISIYAQNSLNHLKLKCIVNTC